MTISTITRITGFLIALSITTLMGSRSAAAPKTIPNPDFTKGESIPAGATHDWNLGATGMRGWIYSERLETRKARQKASSMR